MYIDVGRERERERERCISVDLLELSPNLSKAPQGKERGAMGSNNPPCMSEPLCFSARHGSKNHGLVLRPLFPLCHCLVGPCLIMAYVVYMIMYAMYLYNFVSSLFVY